MHADDPFYEKLLRAVTEPVPAHSLKGAAAGILYLPVELTPHAAAWHDFVHGG